MENQSETAQKVVTRLADGVDWQQVTDFPANTIFDVRVNPETMAEATKRAATGAYKRASLVVSANPTAAIIGGAVVLAGVAYYKRRAIGRAASTAFSVVAAPFTGAVEYARDTIHRATAPAVRVTQMSPSDFLDPLDAPAIGRRHPAAHPFPNGSVA